MNMDSIYSPFLRYFRSKRKRLFHQAMNPKPSLRILDVGGHHLFWKGMECQNPITCFNLRFLQFDETPPQFEYIQGDGRYLPYDDTEYDIVFSNSVIEHLGRYEDQKQFAAEIRRVSESYWVQTPNRWFPVEPHLVSPLIHYFPKRFQRRLIR